MLLHIELQEMRSYLKILKLLRVLVPLLDQGHKLSPEQLQIRSEELRLDLQKLGPTYVKLGQILSVRYDLLHRETCNELQKLLDQEEQALSISEVKKILQREWGTKYKTHVSSIDPEPVAVASLGQVHVGYLKHPKQKIAIKIQKLNLRAIIQSDLKALYRVVRLVSLVPFLGSLQISKVLKEFEYWTLKELDYTIEAANTERFADIFVKDKYVRVPQVFSELTTDFVLVTEFIEGISAKELIKLYANNRAEEVTIKGKKYNRKEVVYLMRKSIYKQIFEVGFVHGDPHPSNILLVDPKTISYIDFGIVAQLSPVQRSIFKQMVFDLGTGNRKAIVEGIVALDQIPGAKPINEIEQHLQPLFDKYDASLSEEYSPTQFLLDLTYNVSKMGIEVPMFLVLLFKVLAIYDGMLQMISPKSKLVEEMLPFFESSQIKDITDLDSIQSKLKENLQPVTDLFKLLKTLPGETLELLHDVRINGIKVNNIDTFSQEQHRSKRSRVVLISLLYFFSLFVVLLSIYTNNGFSDLSWILSINLGIIAVILIFYLTNYD